jgi:hypothetical protein
MHVAVGRWLLFAVLLGCSPARDMEERIAVESRGMLEVDIDFGDGLRPDPGSLQVLSHDAGEVRITAGASGWGASGVRFRVDPREYGVRFSGRVEGAFAWMFGGPRVQVQIVVPREFGLDLRCTTGSIRIEDVNGRVRARTDDAPIEVVGAEGSVKLRTGHGDVEISEVFGDVEVRASAGHIDMRWITGHVEAHTGRGTINFAHLDGDVVVRTDRGNMELREISGVVDAKTERGSVFASFVSAPGGVLETSRGNVRVVVPSGAGANLEAVTRNGSVELGPGISASPGERPGRLTGPINGGGDDLRLYTARGTIHVLAR